MIFDVCNNSNICVFVLEKILARLQQTAMQLSQLRLISTMVKCANMSAERMMEKI